MVYELVVEAATLQLDNIWLHSSWEAKEFLEPFSQSIKELLNLDFGSKQWWGMLSGSTWRRCTSPCLAMLKAQQAAAGALLWTKARRGLSGL